MSTLSPSPPIIYAARLSGKPFVRVGGLWPVVARQCRDGWDYWRGLRVLWVSEYVIVNIEHDMEASAALVADLLECPHPLCTHAYDVHEPTTGVAQPLSAQSKSLAGPPVHPPIEIHDYTARGIERLAPGDEWADFSGIGFCKIEPSSRMGELAPAEWSGVELSVNAAVRSRWHVHWPAIEHYHRKATAA